LAGKSAQKQVRVAARRQRRNKSISSQVKTNITRAEKLIFAGEIESARGAVVKATTSLDKAVTKGIIHGNNAARRKSRLMKKLNATTSSPAAETESKEAA
jgi:small subunit ribosomal protein S20